MKPFLIFIFVIRDSRFVDLGLKEVFRASFPEGVELRNNLFLKIDLL